MSVPRVRFGLARRPVHVVSPSREFAVSPTVTRITGLAVCPPDSELSQPQVLELLGMDTDDKAARIFDRSAVASRDLGLSPTFLSRTLQGRTIETEQKLFVSAVRVIDELGIDMQEVGVVVTASLYSLGGPTIAHRLVEHYAMDPATDKYHIVGVGCASAVPLIRLITQSLADHPGKKGLIVAGDQMSGLMTRANPGDSRAKTIGAAIFGDGCAAAVIEHGLDAPGPAVVASKVHQIKGTLGAVRMELSDEDSFLFLDRALPDLAAAGLAGLVDDFLRPLGMTRPDVDHWVIHPGGRRILECVGEELELTREQIAVSYDVLSTRGNVGTPSIFYVLDETLRRRRPSKGERALMITVGPGVTVGLMLLAF